MKDSKEHLDIDLEFLDKKEAPKSTPSHNTGSSTGHSSSTPTATPVSSGYKYNWKNILIIGGIILFFGWAMFSGSDSSSPSTDTSNTNSYSNTSNSNDGILTGGKYRSSF
jgi:hypothetical protein